MLDILEKSSDTPLSNEIENQRKNIRKFIEKIANKDEANLQKSQLNDYYTMYIEIFSNIKAIAEKNIELRFNNTQESNTKPNSNNKNINILVDALNQNSNIDNTEEFIHSDFDACVTPEVRADDGIPIAFFPEIEKQAKELLKNDEFLKATFYELNRQKQELGFSTAPEQTKKDDLNKKN